MHNTLSHPTYRRWAIFYAAAAALLVGWLLLEKMPDGREELAESVEGAFRGSGKVMERSNSDLLNAMQDVSADYPNPENEEYKKRAEKVQHLAAQRWEHLSLLRDSLMALADQNRLCWGAAQMCELENQPLTPRYKNIKTSQLSLHARMLAAIVLNYCASKVGNTGIICGSGPLPTLTASQVAPVVGEECRAEIVLSDYNDRCYNFTAYLNDQPIPIRDGIATLRTTFPTPGPHALRLRFRRERCRDGSVTEMSRDFQVNVLPKCAGEQ